MRKLPVSFTLSFDENIAKIIFGLFNIRAAICKRPSGKKNARETKSLQIKTGRLEKGSYVISLISTTGEVVHTEEVEVKSRKQQICLQLKNVNLETYFVHVFNRETAASFMKELNVYDH